METSDKAQKNTLGTAPPPLAPDAPASPPPLPLVERVRLASEGLRGDYGGDLLLLGARIDAFLGREATPVELRNLFDSAGAIVSEYDDLKKLYAGESMLASDGGNHEFVALGTPAASSLRDELLRTGTGYVEVETLTLRDDVASPSPLTTLDGGTVRTDSELAAIRALRPGEGFSRLLVNAGDYRTKLKDVPRTRGSMRLEVFRHADGYLKLQAQISDTDSDWLPYAVDGRTIESFPDESETIQDVLGMFRVYAARYAQELLDGEFGLRTAAMTPRAADGSEKEVS